MTHTVPQNQMETSITNCIICITRSISRCTSSKKVSQLWDTRLTLDVLGVPELKENMTQLVQVVYKISYLKMAPNRIRVLAQAEEYQKASSKVHAKSIQKKNSVRYIVSLSQLLRASNHILIYM